MGCLLCAALSAYLYVEISLFFPLFPRNRFLLLRRLAVEMLSGGVKALTLEVRSRNSAALALYRKLGFTQLGTIPGGFLMKDGSYQDIIPHYKKL